MRFRVLVFLFFAFALTSCQTTEVLEPQNIHIVEIRAFKAPNIRSSDTLLPKIENVFSHYVKAYNLEQKGSVSGYRLEITITDIHYKDALQSLLIGDSNRLKANSKLIDPSNGSVLREFETSYLDGGSLLINGISGAILSNAVGNERVDTTFAKGLPIPILKKAYDEKSIPERVRVKMSKTDLLSPFSGELSPLSPAPIGIVEDVFEVTSVE